MIKALITGCSGFIGPHLVESCLAKNWSVLGVDLKDFPSDFKSLLDNNNFTFIKDDYRNFDNRNFADLDYIFALAFLTNIPFSIDNPLSTTSDNIGMTTFLLQQAAENNVKKFCFPSTASQYGNNLTPWTEDLPPNPIEPYSWQKLACEFACKTWTSCYNVPTVILRLFQVFGENQRQDTAMAKFFKSVAMNEPITLTETTAQSSFRSGQRDFVYVKDVAEAFILSATSNKTGEGEIINIGSGRVNSMDQIAQSLGGDIIFIPKRSFEVERHEADITRAHELLAWYPKIEVLSWLRDFSETLKRE